MVARYVICFIVVRVGVMRIAFVFITCLFFINNLHAFSYFVDKNAREAWKNKDYKKVVEILEKEQVNKPNDARLNYNIGNGYYKQGKFKDAQLNYERAVSNCTESDGSLKEKSYFNWGNSFYKSALDVLPDDWEKKDVKIDDKKLDFAIQEAKHSVGK